MTGPAHKPPSRDPAMVETIERSKLREVVADRLKNFILDENLSSGDRLPTETELAAKFGVSRLSLREATKSLEFLGIVEAKPGRGLTVGSVNMERVTEYLGFHPALHDVCPHELIDTRVLIEAGVIPHVARRMKQDGSIYDRLNTINADFNQARSLTRWVELDIAFHRELVCASGLSPLMAFTDLLAVFFRRFRESLKKAEWSDGINGHQEIIDALKAGRVRDAEHALRTHIECHRERMGLPPR
ncbi:FadR/GntR family transcriptional regulator [Schlesneria paludicola]|uniref:FadR/GntR family transcriptional regulator n=1 Tax=Schlesneria paludicola TaxID=360056 RepID=UPI00138B03E2|nr:GntR family transcriptional regulator [Schlesneria paludicola]